MCVRGAGHVEYPDMKNTYGMLTGKPPAVPKPGSSSCRIFFEKHGILTVFIFSYWGCLLLTVFSN